MLWPVGQTQRLVNTPFRERRDVVTVPAQVWNESGRKWHLASALLWPMASHFIFLGSRVLCQNRHDVEWCRISFLWLLWGSGKKNWKVLVQWLAHSNYSVNGSYYNSIPIATIIIFDISQGSLTIWTIIACAALCSSQKGFSSLILMLS